MGLWNSIAAQARGSETTTDSYPFFAADQNAEAVTVRSKAILARLATRLECQATDFNSEVCSKGKLTGGRLASAGLANK